MAFKKYRIFSCCTYYAGCFTQIHRLLRRSSYRFSLKVHTKVWVFGLRSQIQWQLRYVIRHRLGADVRSVQAH